jgi:hypothetical protein
LAVVNSQSSVVCERLSWLQGILSAFIADDSAAVDGISVH